MVLSESGGDVMELYAVQRDGETLVRGLTYPEAFGWLLDHQSQSVEWATKYEGYSIVPEDDFR